MYFFYKICAHDITVMIWTDKIINSKNFPQNILFWVKILRVTSKVLLKSKVKKKLIKMIDDDTTITVTL